jgi:predicted N-formylglutamate amidohydrolase
LAKQLKGILVYSRYSRLYIDVNRPPISKSLIRTEGDGLQIDLNKDISYQEEEKRVKMHSTYFFALSNIFDNLYTTE